MTEPAVPAKGRPDYGGGATRVPRMALYGGLVFVVVGRMLSERGVMQSVPEEARAGGVMIWMGLSVFLVGCVMLLESKVSKLILRERILNSISWRGQEQVLDLGCGRGLLLVGAAKRLESGHVVGIPIRSLADPNGSGAEATLENARLEGVAERVELKDADARALPFAEASFDVVVSGLALHTLDDPRARESAICEIARVLKPGGQLALADIRHTAEYEKVLRSLGWQQTERWSPRLVFLTPVCVLRASKP